MLDDGDWKTWWIRSGTVIALNGSENAHWRYMMANADLVTDNRAFVDLITDNDCTEDAQDWHWRMRMKHMVFTSNWVRTGLIDGEKGYVDGIDTKEGRRELRKAARFLMDQSGGMMNQLAVLIVSSDFELYEETETEDMHCMLNAVEIDQFIKHGHLPTDVKPRRP